MPQSADRASAVHPGEVLTENFLIPMGISQTRLATTIGMPSAQVNEICSGRRPITSEVALQLARVLGMSADYWTKLQTRFDLQTA
jgi:antitoxin HigA-1